MNLEKLRFSNVFRSQEELDLTAGPIGKNLFFLSLPIVVMNLLRTAYNIADTFWLGQLSKEALAAITFAFPLIFFLISLGLGLAVAGSVLVAQYQGKGQSEKVNYTASQTVAFSFMASLLLGSFGYFFVDDLLSVLGAGSKVLPLATGYMQIISMGLFFMFGFATLIALMRGYGDTVTPMLLMFGSVILNILLDPFLIFGWWIFPAMGIEGAAAATVFCRGIAFVAGIVILGSGRKGIKLSKGGMVPDLSFLKKMLAIGIPASIETVGRSASVIVMIAIVGTFATSVVAGFGIGIRIFSLIFLPAIAVGRGVETMSGQNLGAGNFGRADSVNLMAAKVTFLVLSILGVIIFLFPEPIVSVFTKSGEVTSVGVDFLRYVAPTFGFIGILRAFSGGFRGAGRTFLAAVVAISMMAIVRVPIAYLLSSVVGPEGVWVSFPISNVIGALVAALIFWRYDWKGTVVEKST